MESMAESDEKSEVYNSLNDLINKATVVMIPEYVDDDHITDLVNTLTNDLVDNINSLLYVNPLLENKLFSQEHSDELQKCSGILQDTIIMLQDTSQKTEEETVEHIYRIKLNLKIFSETLKSLRLIYFSQNILNEANISGESDEKEIAETNHNKIIEQKQLYEKTPEQISAECDDATKKIETSLQSFDATKNIDTQTQLLIAIKQLNELEWKNEYYSTSILTEEQRFIKTVDVEREVQSYMTNKYYTKYCNLLNEKIQSIIQIFDESSTHEVISQHILEMFDIWRSRYLSDLTTLLQNNKYINIISKIHSDGQVKKSYEPVEKLQLKSAFLKLGEIYPYFQSIIKHSLDYHSIKRMLDGRISLMTISNLIEYTLAYKDFLQTSRRFGLKVINGFDDIMPYLIPIIPKINLLNQLDGLTKASLNTLQLLVMDGLNGWSHINFIKLQTVEAVINLDNELTNFGVSNVVVDTFDKPVTYLSHLDIIRLRLIELQSIKQPGLLGSVLSALLKIIAYKRDEVNKINIIELMGEFDDLNSELSLMIELENGTYEEQDELKKAEEGLKGAEEGLKGALDDSQLNSLSDKANEYKMEIDKSTTKIINMKRAEPAASHFITELADMGEDVSPTGVSNETPNQNLLDEGKLKLKEAEDKLSEVVPKYREVMSQISAYEQALSEAETHVEKATKRLKIIKTKISLNNIKKSLKKIQELTNSITPISTITNVCIDYLTKLIKEKLLEILTNMSLEFDEYIYMTKNNNVINDLVNIIYQIIQAEELLDKHIKIIVQAPSKTNMLELISLSGNYSNYLVDLYQITNGDGRVLNIDLKGLEKVSREILVSPLNTGIMGDVLKTLNGVIIYIILKYIRIDVSPRVISLFVNRAIHMIMDLVKQLGIERILKEDETTLTSALKLLIDVFNNGSYGKFLLNNSIVRNIYNLFTNLHSLIEGNVSILNYIMIDSAQLYDMLLVAAEIPTSIKILEEELEKANKDMALLEQGWGGRDETTINKTQLIIGTLSKGLAIKHGIVNVNNILNELSIIKDGGEILLKGEVKDRMKVVWDKGVEKLSNIESWVGNVSLHIDNINNYYVKDNYDDEDIVYSSIENILTILNEASTNYDMYKETTQRFIDKCTELESMEINESSEKMTELFSEMLSLLAFSRATEMKYIVMSDDNKFDMNFVLSLYKLGSRILLPRRCSKLSKLSLRVLSMNIVKMVVSFVSLRTPVLDKINELALESFINLKTELMDIGIEETNLWLTGIIELIDSVKANQSEDAKVDLGDDKATPDPAMGLPDIQGADLVSRLIVEDSLSVAVLDFIFSFKNMSVGRKGRPDFNPLVGKFSNLEKELVKDAMSEVVIMSSCPELPPVKPEELEPENPREQVNPVTQPLYPGPLGKCGEDSNKTGPVSRDWCNRIIGFGEEDSIDSIPGTWKVKQDRELSENIDDIDEFIKIAKLSQAHSTYLDAVAKRMESSMNLIKTLNSNMGGLPSHINKIIADDINVEADVFNAIKRRQAAVKDCLDNGVKLEIPCFNPFDPKPK